MKGRFRIALVNLIVGTCLCSSPKVLAQNWTQTTAPATNWTSLACSADAKRLVAAVDGGGIFLSADSGVSWVMTSAPILPWQSVAASADGGRIVAASANGFVYMSADGGQSWLRNTGAPVVPWGQIATSGSGTKLVGATCDYIVPPAPEMGIYISNDSGVSWQLLPQTGGPFKCVAASAEGSTFGAVGCWWWDADVFAPADLISTNWGEDFSRIYPQAVAPWSSFACSADGTKMIAGAWNGVWLSADRGGTWMATGLPAVHCGCVAISAEGQTTIVTDSAGDLAGGIYTSADFGDTWTSNAVPAANWSCVTSSADGRKLLAAVRGGGIYRSQATPQPVLNISCSGPNITVSWIVVLQESIDLSSWSPVGLTPTLSDTSLRYNLNLLPTGERKFFRLVSPGSGG